VKSVKSVVQFLWLRRAAPGILSLFAANSMEVLIQEPFARQTGVFPAESGQTQSNPVKPFFYFDREKAPLSR
jgi:hypothetical protein